MTPVAAWKSIVEDPKKRGPTSEARARRLRSRRLGRSQRDHRRRERLYRQELWPGPRVRLLADPGDVDGELRGRRALSVAARRRLHVVLRLVLRPAAVDPQTWGEQTDVPESADWYNSGFLILWGSNVPQTRTPDAHFYTEVRYKGAKSVVICPDYSEASKFADLWISPKQGTDAALAMAMGHVILQGIPRRPAGQVFQRLCPPVYGHADAGAAGEAGRRAMCPSASLRASDFVERMARPTTQNGRRSPMTRPPARSSCPRARSASAGARRASGTWRRGRRGGQDTKLRLSLSDDQGRHRVGRLPLFRHIASTIISPAPTIPTYCKRNVPAKTLHAGRRRDARRVGVRSVRRQLRRRPRLRRREHRQDLRRRRALHAGLGRKDHRRAARPDHHGGARIRAQRREDQRPVDGHPRRRAEPLVPHGHELPRHHQHAGDVRLHRPVRRRLVALCRPGKAAAAVGLDAAGVRARLGPPAAADELDLGVSMPTPTSGATRRSMSRRSCRRPRRRAAGTAR